MEEVHINLWDKAESPFPWRVADVFVHTAQEHDEPHIHIRTDDWEMSVDVDPKADTLARIVRSSENLNPEEMMAKALKWLDMESTAFPPRTNREAVMCVWEIVNEIYDEGIDAE